MSGIRLLRSGWAFLFVVCAQMGLANPVPQDVRDFLMGEGISVSSGAAEGYVPDHVCADCHSDKAESFSEVAMSRSFYRPAEQKIIEDFGALPFYHEPSKRYYEMEWDGEAYQFRRYRMTLAGDKVDEFSVKVDWIMGSGNHARVYLYQTPDGAMFQLPLAWYSQSNEWAMAPGYEKADHDGVLRDIHQRCMACHNAFGDYAENSGLKGYPALYPKDLPEGIGCQRCHGPGAEHAYLAYRGATDVDDVRSAIVQPGKLQSDKTYSVCYGCHMQPNVAVNSQLRLGRQHYGFRPGQDIKDFIAQLDIEEAGKTKDERFEINHHPYRMEQSTSFKESDGALGCLTCHDPHVKIKPEERAAHYRKACLTCHELDRDGLPDIATTEAKHPVITESDDCTICHMPKRRTQDVVEVWMTDHKIVRFADSEEERMKRIKSADAVVERIFPADPDHGVPQSEMMLLQLMALLDYSQNTIDFAVTDLEKLLSQTKTEHYEPWLSLIEAYIANRQFGKARAIAAETFKRAPENPKVINAVAVSRYATGQKAEAIQMLQKTARDMPEIVFIKLSLAKLLAAEGRLDEAMQLSEEIVKLRPNEWQAWALIANLAQAKGDDRRALEAFLTTLEIRPESPAIRKKAESLMQTETRN